MLKFWRGRKDSYASASQIKRIRAIEDELPKRASCFEADTRVIAREALQSAPVRPLASGPPESSPRSCGDSASS